MKQYFKPEDKATVCRK